MPLPKRQCQPDLVLDSVPYCLMEKACVIMILVNCLFAAKKLFNQSRLHNLMSESDYRYVTQ